MSNFNIFPSSYAQPTTYNNNICSCCGSWLTYSPSTFLDVNQGYTILMGNPVSFVPIPNVHQEYILEKITLPDGQTLFIKINTETRVKADDVEDEDEF